MTFILLWKRSELAPCHPLQFLQLSTIFSFDLFISGKLHRLEIFVQCLIDVIASVRSTTTTKTQTRTRVRCDLRQRPKALLHRFAQRKCSKKYSWPKVEF